MYEALGWLPISPAFARKPVNFQKVLRHTQTLILLILDSKMPSQEQLAIQILHPILLRHQPSLMLRKQTNTAINRVQS
jgi:hypothetical protein